MTTELTRRRHGSTIYPMTMKENLILKLSAAQARMVHDRQQLDLQIKKLTAERDAIDGQLKEHMETHGALVCVHRNVPLLELQEWHRNLIDGQRLKREMPEIAQKYTKTSSGRSLKYVAA